MCLILHNKHSHSHIYIIRTLHVHPHPGFRKLHDLNWPSQPSSTWRDLFHQLHHLACSSSHLAPPGVMRENVIISRRELVNSSPRRSYLVLYSFAFPSPSPRGHYGHNSPRERRGKKELRGETGRDDEGYVRGEVSAGEIFIFFFSLSVVSYVVFCVCGFAVLDILLSIIWFSLASLLCY